MDHASSEGEYASDGDSVVDEQDHEHDRGHDIKAESDASPTTSSNAAGKNAPGVRGAVHLQKRRRVTRACDECRRKKIKCDGKQPCTHCTVYSYECTYDQPSNRRRNPAPQYVENLEHRVHRAETLLHILIPNLDLNDPGIDAAVAQGWIPGAPGKGHPTPAQESRQARPRPSDATDKKSDTNLESMVRAVAQLEMDETGHWDYHGHSSGLSFVRRMREQLGDLMGPETVATPFVKTRPMSPLLDSPKSVVESPMGESSPPSTDLPPKGMARQLCSYAVNDAAALLRTVHQPTFWAGFERIYSIPSENYTNEENVFLPLFYAAVALGCLFGKDGENGVHREGYETAIQQGFAYFKTARHLMDIADCRDLASVQAVIFMILFLQSSAKMSQCYAYVGLALRSALRMGLHRSAAGRFDPIEAESRKRVFWIVRKLDIYVGAMLGLPQTLSDEDIDQEFPTAVDDEYITRDGILPMPEGTVSLMTAFNAHTRLVQILQKIVRKIYPIKVQSPEDPGDKSYSIPFSTIREIESDLEFWKNSLPPILSPCEAPARYTRIQHLLRLSYAHAQVLLYRPFLHFTAMEKRSAPADQRAYACAASFVNVSRNIIHIASQMKQMGLLNGPFWFIMYTTFFSILALVYFAAENPDNPTTEAVMKDAIEGREVLASLTTTSMAADRCTATLDIVFQRLPPWMREGQKNPGISKKRPYGQSAQYYQAPNGQASRSHSDVPMIGQEHVQSSKRSSTYPTPGASGTPGTTSPYDGSTWSQSESTYGPQTPTSSSFDSNGFAGATHRSVSHPMSSTMQQYSLPPNFANPQLTDLSTMMFPAADEPFVYPNQPLTTFENNQYAKNDSSFVNQPAYSGVEGSGQVAHTSRGPEENIEARFYTLPPYLEQGQQQQPMPRPQPRQQGMPFSQNMPYIDGQPTSAAEAMQMSNGQWPGQQAFQQNLSNINIHDLFGGAEWNPMFQQGYTSQR
ncbi:Activator of stress 1 [Lecanosticta acicola]|uniref:Activator of stress 1 n=1 Tax=Lecanosticta acicola TaxID=111012 RepID=A0AAI8Z073_9PEZI|nr:Activator of stress 1 [Lecanosticta acicola]